MKTILQRIAEGDPSAVAACVDEYGGLAWRLAQRYLGRAPAEIEDAVQEAFVEIWLSAKRFDPARGSEPAFVATIIHRRLIDHQRRVTSRSATQREASTETMAAPKSIAALLPASDSKQVATAFDKLPDDERVALWMSVCGGLSHSQIATATQSPIGTVKTRLRRGMARLGETLLPLFEGSQAPSTRRGEEVRS